MITDCRAPAPHSVSTPMSSGRYSNEPLTLNSVWTPNIQEMHFPASFLVWVSYEGIALGVPISLLLMLLFACVHVCFPLDLFVFVCFGWRAPQGR